jgi:hypothetical protein
MCRQDWGVHGYTATCNAFKEKTITESLDVQTRAQANLEKWLFYYDRYTNHELSSKLDQELYEHTEAKMVEVQNTSGLSWIQARYAVGVPPHDATSFCLLLLSHCLQVHERCGRRTYQMPCDAQGT